MDENLSKLMKQTYFHPQAGLADDIWRKIQVKQIKSLKIKSLSYGLLGILSLGIFVFVVNIVRVQFVSSGFFQYFSLVFSDGGLMALYWKEYLSSLSDSIPYASVGTAFFLLFLTLISIKKFVYQYKIQLLIIK